MKRRLIFRADANSKIGRGHLSRCIAVAEMLVNDFNINFVYLSQNQDYINSIEMPYNLLVVDSDDDFMNIISENDIVWLDGYNFTESFKSKLRSKIFKLIETNDLPYPAKNVDILFNHTPGINKEQFGTIGKKTDLYLGLDYALLRRVFLNKAKQNNNVLTGKGVFICFGGADTYNLGFGFVKGLIDNDFVDPIYWVGSNNTEKGQVSNNNLHYLSELSGSEMIEYMSKSKVLIIPSSVLSFEAIALRKPVFMGFFVDNQELIYKGFMQKKLAMGVGYLETKQDVIKAGKIFIEYYLDEVKHKKQIKNQQNAMDGYSRERIKNSLQ